MQVVIPVSQCKVTYNFDKTNIFPKNICLILSNPRNFGDRNSENAKIFLKVRKVNGLKSGRLPALLVCLFACLLAQVCRLFDAILLTLAKMS